MNIGTGIKAPALFYSAELALRTGPGNAGGGRGRTDRARAEPQLRRRRRAGLCAEPRAACGSRTSITTFHDSDRVPRQERAGARPACRRPWPTRPISAPTSIRSRTRAQGARTVVRGGAAAGPACDGVLHLPRRGGHRSVQRQRVDQPTFPRRRDRRVLAARRRTAVPPSDRTPGRSA